jgi:hypothetical protein
MATTIQTPPKLYRWKTDPKGKAPAHTVSFKQHQVNRTPIVPGSSINNKTLATQTRAAMDTKYGPLQAEQGRGVRRAQSAARDVGGPGGFYDQYLAQLAQHSQNINAIGQQANAAVGALPAQVTGLAGADAGSLQGAANAGAAARGMGPAGDITGMASNATAIRQGLVASFGAQQAAQNAAAQTYADTLAHVVAPTEKLAGQAVAQGKIKTARDKVTETKRERGASALAYKTDAKASEAKNVLAAKIAGISAETKADAAAETTRAHKANEAIDRARIKAEGKKAANAAAAAGSKSILSGPFAGRSQTWLATATDAQKQRLINAYDAKHAGKGKGKAGDEPDMLSPGQLGDAMSQGTAALDYVKRAMQGKPFIAGHKPQPRLSRGAAEKKVRDYFGSKLSNPFIVRAAADAIKDGHLSAYTVKHLKASGINAEELAAALGTTTHDQWLKTPAGKAWLAQQSTPLPKPPSGKPRFNPAGSNLGRLPGR